MTSRTSSALSEKICNNFSLYKTACNTTTGRFDDIQCPFNGLNAVFNEKHTLFHIVKLYFWYTKPPIFIFIDSWKFTSYYKIKRFIKSFYRRSIKSAVWNIAVAFYPEFVRMFAENVYTYHFNKNRMCTITPYFANSIIERVRRSKFRAYALVARRAHD